MNFRSRRFAESSGATALAFAILVLLFLVWRMAKFVWVVLFDLKPF